MTNTLLYGLGPNIMRKGGTVCIAVVAKVPWLLRHLQDEEYEFLGECYVHGAMDRQYIDLLEGSGVITEYVNLQ